ncbi:hypothetical protein MC885_013507 [Smutsia gigantea]|nr:hypothetical protein MC885_013507 [Smutsia gigantea]
MWALDTMNFDILNGKPMHIMCSQHDPLLCNIVSDENGSKGFRFVHFQKSEAATKAIARMNGTSLRGSRLFVGPFKPRRERETELRAKRNIYTNVYIKNIGDDVDDECLKKVFITSDRVMKEAGHNKAFGFICSSSPEEANKPIMAMNRKTVVNKPLYVVIAQSKKECQALLTKNYMNRMQLFNRKVHIFAKPIVTAKLHPSQNTHCVIHSATATAKSSASTSRPSQLPEVKTTDQITITTTETMTVHPQASTSVPLVNEAILVIQSNKAQGTA